MANTVIKHQPSTAGSNRYKYTISGWFKRSKLTDREMFLRFDASSGGYFFFEFKSDDTIGLNDYDGGATGRCEYQVTSRKFRDTNAYYHLVLTVDSTETSSSDRVKIWVNGELQTIQSNGSEVCPSNYQTFATSGALQYVGGDGRYATRYYNGVISHLHFCEGYAYDASDFGSTDANGVWKIKTSPSVTYGTNGFFLFKDDNSLTDRSGQGNNFSTHSGTLTKTEDCPSNVFATFNPLLKTPSALSYLNGNTTVKTTNSQWEGSISTIAPSSGKWYWEARYNTGTGIKLDIVRQPTDLRFFDNSNQSYGSYNSNGYGYQLNNSGTDYYCSNNTCTTWSSSRGNSTKIYMVAVDLDNGKYWIGADGTWFNTSGTANPTTGDDPRHSFSAKLNGDAWFMCMSCEGNGNGHNANFGNGYFGTTAVSSAGTNASGNGIFEYDVPTGYTALSTKGLNL